MTEMLGGLITMGSSSLMVAAAISLARARAAELVAALPFTPTPDSDVALDALLTSID